MLAIRVSSNSEPTLQAIREMRSHHTDSAYLRVRPMLEISFGIALKSPSIFDSPTGHLTRYLHRDSTKGAPLVGQASYCSDTLGHSVSRSDNGRRMPCFRAPPAEMAYGGGWSLCSPFASTNIHLEPHLIPRGCLIMHARKDGPRRGAAMDGGATLILIIYNCKTIDCQGDALAREGRV
jgi:hypothetical protein